MRPSAHDLTRRGFLDVGGGAAVAAALGLAPARPLTEHPAVKAAVAKLQYLTPSERIVILDKGKTGVSKLAVEQLRALGLTPETWSLEVVADPASNSILKRSLTRSAGTAITWPQLMSLSATRSVRFLHLCNCTNGADPFHMSLWEGVPLAEVIRLVDPRDNVRRVYYESYHPEGVKPFLSSLALGQILECPPGELPVILAYKMNDQPIPASLGGPVRMVVPGAYGSKSIKWLQRLVLTNDFKGNDSDADLNNDPENAQKTRARFANEPKELTAGKEAAITGLAQVGVSGLRKVQYCGSPLEKPHDDPFRLNAEWRDATILPPPADWGGGLPQGKLPPTLQTDRTGKPLQWPLRYTIVHWAALVPPLAAGKYEFCCRTIDGNGIAQPLPRTLPRTGFNALHAVTVTVV